MEVITNEEQLDNIEKEDSGEGTFLLADVVALNNNKTAKIKFNGEETPSDKEYSYLTSYYPKVGDRVVLGRMAGTAIILGAVRYKIKPEDEVPHTIDTENIKCSSLTVRNYAKFDTTVNAPGVYARDGLYTDGVVRCKEINSNNSTINVLKDTRVYGEMRASSFYQTSSTRNTLGSTDVNGSLYASSFRCGSCGFNGASAQSKKYVGYASSDTQTRDKLNSLIGKLAEYGLIYN